MRSFFVLQKVLFFAGGSPKVYTIRGGLKKLPWISTIVFVYFPSKTGFRLSIMVPVPTANEVFSPELTSLI